MKEEEFFIELRNLIWNEFPYCRLNKQKIDPLINLNTEFEDIRIFDVDFLYLNIERHLRYRIDVNGIKQRGEELKQELALQVVYDIKEFKIDNVD